jgi:hypothetical protein
MSNLYNCCVQHLDLNGTERFAHNGVVVSTNNTRHHLDPAFVYNQVADEILVFWNERNSNQSQWGIYAQKFSPAGLRQWGDAGLELLPVNTTPKSFPRAVGSYDGAMVFLMDEPNGTFGQDRVIGMRVDGTGAKVWPGPFIGVSTRLSSKARLPVTVDLAGTAKLIWEDNRSGNVDVYGQSVNSDGSLGQVPEGVLADGPTETRLLLEACPNPFHSSTEIRWTLPGTLAGAGLRICNVRGEVVHSASFGALAPGAHRYFWNGRGTKGDRLPAGVYYYQLVQAGRAIGEGRVLTVR